MTFAPSESLSPTARLSALEARLSVYDDLETALIPKGLLVRSLQDTPRRSDTITCRPREDDGDRSWFFTSAGRPIAEAGRVTDAAVEIYGYLIGTD